MTSNSERGEKNALRELLEHVKSSSRSEIIASLLKIKEDPQSSVYLLEDGGLEVLVSILENNTNLQIQNSALSILADLCLITEARNKVRATKLSSHTLFLLKNIRSAANLHCRACRLLGNLAEDSWHAKNFFELGALDVLEKILKSKSTGQTYSMSIRAIRNIWTNCVTSRECIIESGIIKTITKIFILPENKKDLTETCLKALCAFLFNLNPRCAEQMKGGKDIEGYKKILDLNQESNKLSIRVLFNLSQIAECRPALGECGAVNTVIEFLENEDNFASEYLISLCLFCREAINRLRLRENSGIEILLNFLKNSKYKVYHHVILQALTQFMHDDGSINTMVKNGLLDILVDKLKSIVIDLPRDQSEKKVPLKRADDCAYKKRDAKLNRSNYSRHSSDYYPDDWSPTRSTSASSSPRSTSPYSLFDDLDELNNTAEENYSPVCSDTEMIDEEVQEEVESLKSYSSNHIELEDSSKSLKLLPKSFLNEQLNFSTLALLSKLSYSEEPIERLADPATIEPLTEYVKYGTNQRASRILGRIINNRAYFMTLIKQGFVFEIQNLSDSVKYSKPMCSLAEIGGTIGELSSILIRGHESHKLITAVSIPFLIRSKKNLSLLLNTHGGLPLIFQILENSEHDMYDKAVWSICELADVLKIGPTPDTRESLDRSHSFNNLNSSSFSFMGVDNFSKLSTVTFELDDGSTVEANRKTLCQKSDAFSAMLGGGFSESGKRKVKLKNTSSEGLQTLLLAADGRDYDDRGIESLLDAVLLADKFLMTDLSEELTETSILKLNYQNMNQAWTWARKNSCQELKLCCVKRILTAKMTKAERLRAFRDFSNNDNFAEFLDEVKELIGRELSRWV